MTSIQRHAGYCIAKKKRHGDRGPGNPEGPFLRASYDEYAAFSDLLGYLPRSEKPYSPEADDDAPRAMVYFPAKHLFYILTLRKCAQLATCLHLLPPLPSPAPDSFSLWKSKIIPLLNRSFHRVTCCKIPNVASGLCISWGRMWESEQRSTSGISPHSVDTAFSAGHQITFMTVVPMPRPTRAASDVTPGPLSSRFFSLPFPNLPTISFAFPPNWKK